MPQPVTLALAEIGLLTRGGRALVADVSLAIPAGAHWAVVGPNGAGKTSLLRLVTGQVQPTRGTVLLDGRPLSEIPPRERALRMAAVAQRDTPDDRLRLDDYVALGRLPHRGRVGDAEHRRIVGDALARTGLSGLANRTLGTLSGGERQRGALARALAQEPGLLVLDEPTNHLDPRARTELLGVVKELGITVLAVLHDLPLAVPFADIVVVMREGRVVAAGPAAEALAPAVVRDVFALDSFQAVSPTTGRPVLVLDAPLPLPTERTDHAISRLRGRNGPGPVLGRAGHRLSGDGR